MTFKAILKQPNTPIKAKTHIHRVKPIGGLYYCCKIRGGMCNGLTTTSKGMKFHLMENHGVLEEKIRIIE